MQLSLFLSVCYSVFNTAIKKQRSHSDYIICRLVLSCVPLATNELYQKEREGARGGGAEGLRVVWGDFAFGEIRIRHQIGSCC